MNIADEAKLRTEASRGQRAQQLLADELLAEAFAILRETYTNAMWCTKVEDSKKRDNIWLMKSNLDAVEGHLKTILETGKMAAKQLETERTRLQKTKEWLSEVMS